MQGSPRKAYVGLLACHDPHVRASDAQKPPRTDGVQRCTQHRRRRAKRVEIDHIKQVIICGAPHQNSERVPLHSTHLILADSIKLAVAFDGLDSSWVQVVGDDVVYARDLKSRVSARTW